MFNPHIQVVEDIDELTRNVWNFAFLENVREGQLVVETYRTQTRPSTRHGFRNTGTYSRLDSRNTTIKADDVPLPELVKEKAIGEFLDIVRAMPVTVAR